MKLSRSGLLLALANTLLLCTFALLTYLAQWPPTPGVAVGPLPDSPDYAYGALSLLHGRYEVCWEGPCRPPHYPPGMSLLLLPSVAIGGVESAVLTNWMAGLALAVLLALLANRLGGRLAIPVALGLMTLSPAVYGQTTMVMSDLPASLLLAAQLALLPHRPLGAGLLAGSLVWVRLSTLPLPLAGLLAMTAYPHCRPLAARYLLGAAGPILALALWQWAALGSPLTTSYDQHPGSAGWSLVYLSSQAHPDGTGLGGHGLDWGLPSSLAYPLQLAGLDGFLYPFGAGALGLLWIATHLRGSSHDAALARFASAGLLVTLAVYLPYFWQSGRFLLPAGVLVLLASSVCAGRLPSHLASLRWPRPVLTPTPSSRPR